MPPFLGGIFGILLIASGIVFALKRAHPDKGLWRTQLAGEFLVGDGRRVRRRDGLVADAVADLPGLSSAFWR
jgi:hypothetical protein